ncbi:MAG: lipopolysaccharide biosynthesis protein [Actinomycetota bacterium]
MTTPAVEPGKRGFRAPGTTFMVTGGLLGAFGAYVFQVYGTRNLDPDAFAPVSVLWTAFFILATVLLVPVEQYVTREVASGRRALPGDLKPALLLAGVGGLVGGVFVWVTLDQLFFGEAVYIAQIVLLMVGYSLLFTGKGVLAGRRRFAGVGWVLIVETVARLVAGVVLLQFVLSATSLGWAMVIGGFSVLALGWWRHDVGESRASAAPPGRFLSGYVGGTTSSQLLLAGAPLAVAALGGSPTLISIIFVTFTLYRAPLTLIFNLQGRILPYLVGLYRDANHVQLRKIARWLVLGGGALAVLGAFVGWLVGSEVVGLLYGDQYAPVSTVAMLAAGGVMAAAAAQVTSQVLVAEGRTGRLTWAWLGGLVVGILVMLLASGEPDTQVAIGFAAGETTALGLMGWLAIRR